MNTLGKTVVSVTICLAIIAALFFSWDFGAPSGMRGDGFTTQKEAVEFGIGNSYNIEQEIGTVEFDDGLIYLCKTKDQKIVACYLFKNRQQTKYYFESYNPIDDISKVQWHESKNKVKTNFLVTSADNIINNCDNKSVEHKDYSIMLNDTKTNIRLYYNRV